MLKSYATSILVLEVHDVSILDGSPCERGAQKLLSRKAHHVAGASELAFRDVNVPRAVGVDSKSLRQIVSGLWIVLNRVLGYHPTTDAHLDLEAASRVAEDVDFAVARGGDVRDEDTAEL